MKRLGIIKRGLSPSSAMGIAAIVILLGYIFAGFIIGAIIFISVIKIGKIETASGTIATIIVLFLIFLSPVWYVLSGRLLIDYACSNWAGINISDSEAIHLTSFQDNREYVNYFGAPEIGSSISLCNSSCQYQIGAYFSQRHIDYFGSIPGFKIERKWKRGDDDTSNRYIQLWLENSGSSNCIVQQGNNKCIAGSIVESPESHYEFIDRPFRECSDGKKKCWDTPNAWKHFDVVRSENHVKKDGRLVARVVAFKWGSPQGFYWRTCPFGPQASGTMAELLLKSLVNQMQLNGKSIGNQ
ncbi:MAG: hypothetical protein KJ795_02925 [Gammaproteobacteria bacterium]|nr:hypothetical protein [Gammaproteobacteria bacterium]MBU1967722.1 hypothetical protein [Gammaproteobacteria bacterium]